MEKPEEIKIALYHCWSGQGCRECPYDGKSNCEAVLGMNALAYIDILEETLYGLAEEKK